MYSDGENIDAFTNGSLVFLIDSVFGILYGASTSWIVPSFNTTSYTTDGDVAIKSILNSLLILSSTISMCNKPKNPVLNPNPRAFDVSGS